jgi:hypothetical protein
MSASPSSICLNTERIRQITDDQARSINLPRKNSTIISQADLEFIKSCEDFVARAYVIDIIDRLNLLLL